MSLSVAVTVAADRQRVWQRFVDLPSWPDWNPACTSAGASGPLTAGTRLRLQLIHPRGRAFLTMPTLTRVVVAEEVEWETRSLGFRAPTSITFTPDGDGTHVSLTSSSRGLLAFTYRLLFPEKMQGLVWSGALTGLAQSFRDEH